MESTNDQVEDQIERIMQQAGKHGIRVDWQIAASNAFTLRKEQTTLEDSVTELLGFPLRMSSRKDVGHVVFDVLGLPETPKRSVSKDYLDHTPYVDSSFVKFYRRWTTVSRTASLIESMEPWIVDGRLMTHWKTRNETSGRIYCEDFNVQQLPKAGRYALIPDVGYRWLLFDYKAFEFRVFAALAGFTDLIKEMNAGVDPHVLTAASMFEVDVATVTEEQRKWGKVFNFGLVFGMDAAGLAHRLDSTISSAQSKIDQFFFRMPRAASYIATVQENARKSGYVENPLGHRRNTWDPDPAKAARQAICTLVQGTAASILKRTLIRVAEALPVMLAATVHDSGLVQIPESNLEFYSMFVIKLADTEFMGVRLPVDATVATSWGEAMDNLETTSPESASEESV